MAADQERADRIRALKHGRPDLTWRRIADYVGVTERSATDWQSKGGISYENAKKLASLFEVDVDYIWRGTETGTPDPFAAAEQPVDTQLAEIRELLAKASTERAGLDDAIRQQALALQAQAEVLRELRDTVSDLRETIATQQAAARHLEQLTAAAVQALPPADPPPARARKSARTGTSPGS